MATTAGLRPLPVTDEDIAAYRRDGAVLIRNLLSKDELALLKAGIEQGREKPSAMFSRYQGSSGSGETIIDQLPSKRSPMLRRLLEESPVAQLAARTMGSPSAQLVLDQIFYKEAGEVVPTPWHQDTPFLNVRGNDLVRIWLPCDPSPRDVAIQVVRGSHLWNVIYSTSATTSTEPSSVVKADEGDAFTYDGVGGDDLPPIPDIDNFSDSFEILSWDTQPGDAVVFHGNILHGARGKASHPHRRRALAVLFGGPQLRYHIPAGHGMPLPGDGEAGSIPEGAPIGDYPDVFPVTWRES